MKKPRVIPTVVLGNVTSDSYDERTRKFDDFKNTSLEDVEESDTLPELTSQMS